MNSLTVQIYSKMLIATCYCGDTDFELAEFVSNQFKFRCRKCRTLFQVTLNAVKEMCDKT